MDSNIVNNICGVSENNIDLSQIGNDPNFVFTPDPSFTPLQLFDIDGNSIIVNSWLECANYVNGGWIAELIVENTSEQYFFFTLLVITCISLIKDSLNYFKKHDA